MLDLSVVIRTYFVSVHFLDLPLKHLFYSSKSFSHVDVIFTVAVSVTPSELQHKHVVKG